MNDQDSMPTFYAFFALFRNILIRERIDVVHAHQATSCMTNECILYARTMRYKVSYTDHSLFGFADAASIHINKVLKFTLSDLDHAIAVSNTCRENLVLRAGLNPASVATIPNAVDPTKFLPDPTRRVPSGTVNVVIVSLTESFCIAILEAACCGLFVVSTRVGGVPEVLPPDMMQFAEPDADMLLAALGAAIGKAANFDPAGFHARVRDMYSWADVARRTELVYTKVMRLPTPSLAKRFERYLTAGPIAGWVCCAIAAVLHLLLRWLEWTDPAGEVERAPELAWPIGPTRRSSGTDGGPQTATDEDGPWPPEKGDAGHAGLS